MADSAHSVQTVRGDEALTVRESITVNRGIADAFRLFTDGIGEWWPLKSSPFSYGGERADKIFLETKVGGRFYERFSDGEEFVVGRVTACEPPTRIVFTWKDPSWKVPTEVEVRFSPSGTGTRVDLEHRGFDAAGVQPEEAAGWGDGWKTVLAAYVEAANRPNSGR
jgi:uncharacterized protein YndB with AHSA1/START domain